MLAAKRAAKFVDKVTETGDDLAARRAELQRIAELLAQRTADIARIARDKLKSSLDYALGKEAMEHVFVPKHKLDGLVKSLGGEEATMTKIIESVQGVPDGVKWLESSGAHNQWPNRPYSRRNDQRCLQNRHRIHSMM